MTGQVIAHFTTSIQAVKDVSFLPVTAFYDSIHAQPLSPMAQTQSWEHETPLFSCIFCALFWTSSQRWPSVQPAFLSARYARWQQENGAFGSSAVGWVKTYTLVISATLIAHNFIFNRVLQRCPFFLKAIHQIRISQSRQKTKDLFSYTLPQKSQMTCLDEALFPAACPSSQHSKFLISLP